MLFFIIVIKMENEKKYFNSQRYGYGMIDQKKEIQGFGDFRYFNKYKPCHLELVRKEIVPKEDETNDKAYQYMYTYKMVPYQNSKFVKIPSHLPFIYKYALQDEYVTYFKDD